ncbi:uncharacterized protein TNCV_4673791 [Trichonephila clavipes]|nr:uncharacterized protein TNCV_4673791 [Trichonephila clavipes]
MGKASIARGLLSDAGWSSWRWFHSVVMHMNLPPQILQNPFRAASEKDSIPLVLKAIGDSVSIAVAGWVIWAPFAVEFPGHSSTDCTLEPKCINCSQPHTADSKLCPKWKTEKQIQEIKTNRNITYVEARKLIVPQTSHTYAQAAKSSNKTSSTQTDENITKIKCPPLELLQPLSSTTRTNISISTPDVSTSSSSTQAQLLPSTSSISTSNSESQPPIP